MPLSVYFFKVVVVPLTGDPDIYVSFDTPTPTGANYTFMQDMVGVDVFRLARNNYLFCGSTRLSGAPCTGGDAAHRHALDMALGAACR